MLRHEVWSGVNSPTLNPNLLSTNKADHNHIAEKILSAVNHPFAFRLQQTCQQFHMFAL
jgi:D-alanyl-D-alanine carboxypeptidase